MNYDQMKKVAIARCENAVKELRAHWLDDNHLNIESGDHIKALTELRDAEAMLFRLKDNVATIKFHESRV